MSITIKEIARLAGVSKTTVSLVMSGKDSGRVSAGIRDQILDLSRKHGYRSNLAAKGLAHGRTYRIGACIAGTLGQYGIWGNFSFYERLGMLSAQLKAASYSINLIQTDTRRPVDAICREIMSEAVDGIIFLLWPSEVVSKLLLPLKVKGTPSVVIGATLEDGGLTWTNTDVYATFIEATRILLREGHRQIALLDMDLADNSVLKEAAFKKVVADMLKTDAEPWIFRARSALSYEHALENIGRALEAMPENRAFLLTDNFYNQVFMHELRQRGFHPGRDCRVIGYGESELADRSTPKLSHFSLRLEEQVDFAVKALLDQINNPAGYEPRHALLPPNYIHRET